MVKLRLSPQNIYRSMYSESTKIDVVTTALRRPDLLDLTYTSFFKQIKDLPDVRLIINVDPIGDATNEEIVNVVERFSNDYEIRFSKEGSFVEAIKWCFAKVRSDIYMHLEDDWLLNKTLCYGDLVNQLKEKNLSQLVLPMKKKRVDDFGYSFRPHLADKVCAEKVTEISDSCNPEKSYKLLASRYNWRAEEYDAHYLVTDMGRKWSKSNGWSKANSVSFSSSSTWFKKRKGLSRFLGILEFKILKMIWQIKLRIKLKGMLYL